MTVFKKVKDISNLDIKTSNRLSGKNANTKQKYGGVGGNKLIEPVPNYNSTPSEKIIDGGNNSSIVLGRDRPAGRFSGYSGKGATQAGSIDIVVGRGASAGVKEVNKDGDKVFVDPNFKVDAARIHISQKTDIDDNFDIVPGEVGKSVSKSGVGIKADGVRIVGRESIKLVTGTDSTNCQGGSIGNIKGIDLIAGNSEKDIQPIPKGNNLKDAINRLVEHQKSLTGIVESFLTAQMAFNSAITAHTHPVTLVPAPLALTSPELAVAGSSSTISELVNSFLSSPAHRINLESFKLNYCTPVGNKYINSRHNSTN